MQDYRGKRVLILGAARQGTAVARFLIGNNAIVTVNDSRSAQQFSDLINELNTLRIKTVFGDHPFTLLENCDLLCISGGVPLDLPIIQEAQKRGIPLTNDSQIFFEELHARSIGITGSAGKTTTTTLVGAIAKQACRQGQQAWIGGNIGTPLISSVQNIQPDDFVVLELSSFQLELMTHSPTIAAVTNITPNHLDRHGSMQAYTAAKAHILEYQQMGDCAILNREDEGSWNLKPMVKGNLITFGLQKPDGDLDGTFISNGFLCAQQNQLIKQICPVDCVRLRGEHNLLNALAACAIAIAAEMPFDAIQGGIEKVQGIPHRLEFVRRWHGADWYNDSIATTPERTLAAIHAFQGRLILLLGGRDKKLPWGDLAAEVHQRADHVFLFGEAADLIETAFSHYENGNPPYSLEKCGSMENAIQAATRVVKDNDIVLLSPGGTSYDAFKDFEERGDQFKQIVESLP